jgi:hypothetical protein
MGAEGELVELFQAVDTWLASLHPAMADVSSVQLLSVLVISWLGCRAIAGPSNDDDPPPPREKTLAEVQEILRRARRRR